VREIGRKKRDSEKPNVLMKKAGGKQRPQKCRMKRPRKKKGAKE
jgi:hypothetical protein